MGRLPVKKNIGLIILVILYTATGCIQFPIDATPIPTIPNSQLPVMPALPDYLWVTYVYNGNIYIWKEDNPLNHTQLSSDGKATAVTISADGELIVYISNGQIFSVASNGQSQPKLLASNIFLSALLPPGYSDYHIHQLDISPDANTVYFSITINSGSGGNDLFKVDTQVQIPANVLPPGQGGNFHFSPNGRCVAIARSNELLLMCDQGQPRPIFNFPPECGFGADNGPEIVWKSDSSGFYIVTPELTQDHLNVLVKQDYWFIPVVGNPQFLKNFTSWLFDPTYISPDGSKVAYMYDRGDLVSLHILNMIGDDVSYLSYPGAKIGFINWNPDSTRMTVWLYDSDIPRLVQNDPQSTYPDLKQLIASQPIYSLSDLEAMTFPSTLSVNDIRWVDSGKFIYIDNQELWVETIGGPRVLIQNGVSYTSQGPGGLYDFPHIP
jgi:hypothetical protein